MLKHILIDRHQACIALAILLLAMNPYITDNAYSSIDTGISITSHKMTVRNQENLMIFEGKVTVTKEDLTINADQLKVYFVSSPQGILSSDGESKNKKDSNNDKNEKNTPVKEVSSMEATGNVTLIQGDKRGKADKAIYYKKDDMIILMGNAEMWEKDYNVKGKRMTIYLGEERSIVEESKVRIDNNKK
ncbi:MAG: LptA/OstA family protein [Nitrospirota bacterium]